LYSRRDVPGCDECNVEDENPAEFVESGAACAGCPYDTEIKEPIVFKLLEYVNLQNAGCPIDRHELRTEEWILFGRVKAELERLEKVKSDGD
jgi:hypothetical protein